MSKIKKRLLLIFCASLVAFGVIFGAFRIHEHRGREAEMEIAETYARFHYAVGWGTGSAALVPELGTYMCPTDWGRQNRFGIDVGIYLNIKFYEHESGNTLSYETLMDYFAEEFEPDGSLRLYNNGKHPELQAFVEWRWESRQQPRTHRSQVDIQLLMSARYQDYGRNNDEFKGFPDITLGDLSPQMLDALVRSFFDPDYVLDLTSIQQAGY